LDTGSVISGWHLADQKEVEQGHYVFCAKCQPSSRKDKIMKLYSIERTDGKNDTFFGAIVEANNENEARHTHPSGFLIPCRTGTIESYAKNTGGWVSDLSEVKIVELGNLATTTSHINPLREACVLSTYYR
jgi:hypothetical protein